MTRLYVWLATGVLVATMLAGAPARAGGADACGSGNLYCQSLSVSYDHLGCDASFCYATVFMSVVASSPAPGYVRATAYWSSPPGGTSGLITTGCSWLLLRCETGTNGTLTWRKELGCNTFGIFAESGTGPVSPLVLNHLQIRESIQACSDGTLRLP